MSNQFIEKPANKSSLVRRKLVCGVGTNDANYVTQPNVNGKSLACPYYKSWRNMIERSYSVKYQKNRPTYIGCSVCDEWLLFSKFKAWMVDKNHKGKALDKDIIKPGNKVYSPETCAFVTREVNQAIIGRSSTAGSRPAGSHWCSTTKKFISKMKKLDKSIYLGCFDSEVDAISAYKKAKRKYILELASTQSDKRVADGLRLHADLLL